ncbi:MAG: hypothetical protein AAF530_06820 [Pseudomonadota bacterium]
MPILKQQLAVLMVCGLAGLLIACGKASAPFPPEDQAGAYTYPNAYPPPDSVVPNFRAPKFEEPEEEDEPQLSPSPYDRTTTKVFDSE